MELLAKTAQILSSHAGERIAIGVSGGRDSMCLLHAAAHCGAMDRSRLIAVHVNHALRAEADSDQAFVREFCEKIGVSFCAFRVDVRLESKNKGLTIEQAARNLRYGVFYDLIKSRAADRIMTAHHALDNAESVLMHLLRGSGLDGLCEMDGELILRPFIDVYPDELDEYARRNGIEYVQDKTNFDDSADRNFLRLNVFPLIEKRYPGAVRAINGLSRECRATCEYLNGLIDGALISESDGAIVISDAALRTPLAMRYVRAALDYFTLVDVTREQVERAAGLADMRTGAVMELSNGVKAAREPSGVALYIPREKYAGELPLRAGANYIDGLAVDAVKSDASPVNAVGAVDFEKLDGAVLRFRRDGDVFRPFGCGEKKLKQYFIDQKVPKRLRDRIPLVCRGSEVLVVVGMQVSERVRQTGATKEKYVITRRW